MNKLDCKSHTLDELIIQQGLCAVGTLDDDPRTKDLVFVVGGAATQSYLPSTCRRPSTDIDLAVLRPFGKPDIKDFARHPLDYLIGKGYTCQLRHGQNSYQLLYAKDDQLAVIEFARRNTNNYNKHAPRLTAELSRARRKIVEGTDSTCRFASPEDIVAPKLVRTVNSFARDIGFMDIIMKEGYFPLTSEGVSYRLRKIERLREEASLHVGDPAISERLRIVCDMYDIRVLSAVAGYNEPSLLASMKPWDSLRSHPEEVAVIFSHLLPKFSSDFLRKFKSTLSDESIS